MPDRDEIKILTEFSPPLDEIEFLEKNVKLSNQGRGMMNNLQKSGGIAALYAGTAYIVGIIGFLLVVGWPDNPVEQVVVIMNHQVSQHILYLIVYQIWAIFLVVLNLALYERLKTDSPATMKVVAAVGMIWATLIIASGMIVNIGMDTVVNIYDKDPSQATTVWIVIGTVCNGIGGGNEILGGLWMLVLNWVALQSGKLPRRLNYIGIVVGLAGVFSALPKLGDLGLIFGLIQIIWFIWLGVYMLQTSSNADA